NHRERARQGQAKPEPLPGAEATSSAARSRAVSAAASRSGSSPARISVSKVLVTSNSRLRALWSNASLPSRSEAGEPSEALEGVDRAKRLVGPMGIVGVDQRGAGQQRGAREPGPR